MYYKWQSKKMYLPIRRGSEVKSLNGTGMRFVMYSQMTSILYLSWADTGITGAPSATVPIKQEQFCCPFIFL